MLLARSTQPTPTSKVVSLVQATSTPIPVTGAINVPASNTLTIDPGVNVYFNADVQFSVAGIVNAIADSTYSIRFVAGTAPEWGGIRIDGDTCSFRFVRFSKGDADGVGDHSRGGAVFVKNGGAYLERCKLTQNVAMNGGALSVETTGELNVVRTVIWNCAATNKGGAIYGWQSTLNVEHCTILGNTATTSAHGLYVGGTASGVIDVVNSILWDNVDELVNEPTNQATVNVTYSDVMRTSGVFPGTGNLNEKPDFADSTNGDFHLTETSTDLIDAGDPALPYDPDATQADIGVHFYYTDNTVPVFMSSFTASALGEAVLLNWSTSSEVKNLGWEIYRITVDDSIVARQANSYGLHDIRLDGNRLVWLEGKGSTQFSTDYRYVDADVIPGSRYAYWIVDVDFIGTRTLHGPITVSGGVPHSLKLRGNHPNPFNPATTIRFDIPTTSAVQLSVHNILGQPVRTLVNRRMEAGFHSVAWNGTDNAGRTVSSGIYIYRLRCDNTTMVRRMTLVR
jgi:flagellar hook capping protein FlgD